MINNSVSEKNWSWDQAIVTIADFISESIDKNWFSRSCFNDFKKAFDTIERRILIETMERYD